MASYDKFHGVWPRSDCRIPSYYKAVSKAEEIINPLDSIPKRTFRLSRVEMVVPRRLASKAQLATEEYGQNSTHSSLRYRSTYQCGEEHSPPQAKGKKSR